MENLFKHRIQFEYFHFLIRKHGRYLFLMILLMVVMNPLMIITFNARSQISATTLLTGQLFNTSIALITTFVVPILLFSFLSNKQSLDVFLALPIKKKDLYVTLFFTGIFMILFPYFVGWASGLIVNLITGIHVGRTLGYFFISLLPLISVYSLVLYVILNTGNILNTLLYSVFIQFLPLFVYYGIFYFWNSTFLGYYFNFTWLIIAMLSPIANLYYNFMLLDIPAFLHFYWLAWVIVLYIINRQFFLHRKVEHAGKAFTNSFFFPLMNGVTIIALQLIVYAMVLQSYPADSIFSIRTLVFPLIIALIIYILLDVITRRHLRNVISAAFHYLVIGSLVFGLLLPLRFTNGLGFITYIPKEVEQLTFTVEDYSGTLFSDQYELRLIVTDPNEIQQLQDFHQLILTEMEEYDFSESLLRTTMNQEPTSVSTTYPYFDSGTSFVHVEFRYQLKDDIVIRNYDIPLQWTYPLLELQDTLAFFDAYYTYLDGKTLTSLQLLDSYQTQAIDITKRLSSTNLKDLLLKDFNNESLYDRFHTSYQLLGYLQYQYCEPSNNTTIHINSCIQRLIPITDGNVNLLNYFNNEDIKIPESEPIEKVILIFPDSSDSRKDYFHYINDIDSTSTIYKIAEYLDQDNDYKVHYTYLSTSQQVQIQKYLVPSGLSEKAVTLVILGNNDPYDSDNMILMVNEDSLELVLNLIAGNEIYIADTIEDLYSIDIK